MAKQSLDDLLAKLEDVVDDTDLLDNLRDAIDAEADNPNLVRNLRSQLNTVTGERDNLRLAQQTDVLTKAGVPEAAHKRFLRDWNDEKISDEFTVDNVKAKAGEFGYRLETPGDGGGDGGDGGDGKPGNDDEQRRREAQQRRQDARAHGNHDDGLPPDLDTQIEEARAAGNHEAVFALNRQKMEKAS